MTIPRWLGALLLLLLALAGCSSADFTMAAAGEPAAADSVAMPSDGGDDVGETSAVDEDARAQDADFADVPPDGVVLDSALDALDAQPEAAADAAAEASADAADAAPVTFVPCQQCLGRSCSQYPDNGCCPSQAAEHQCYVSCGYQLTCYFVGLECHCG